MNEHDNRRDLLYSWYDMRLIAAGTFTICAMCSIGIALVGYDYVYDRGRTFGAYEERCTQVGGKVVEGSCARVEQLDAGSRR